MNRLDEIVVFKPLSTDNLVKVVEIQLQEISVRLADRGFVLEVTPRACEFILKSTYDPQYGARPLKRFLEKNIVTKISRMILADKTPSRDREGKKTKLLIDCNGEELMFT